MQLTTNQRNAIKQMLSHLYNNFGVGQWNERALTYFSDYGLPTVDTNLAPDTYYKTLSELPLPIKRDIILRIFKAWCSVCDYHRLSLFNAFTTLISLRICSGAEYLFMGAVVELLKYFGTDDIWCEADSNHYELNYGDCDSSIQFNINGDGERVQILIAGNLIDKITPFDYVPENTEIQPLFEAIERKPFKRLFPRVCANANLRCSYSNYGYDKGVVEFNLSNIIFIEE